MMLTAALMMMLIGRGFSDSEDYCYDESHCDPYAWGETFPSCHPLLEEHHSPINLDYDMTRNASLDALRLEGFDTLQSGHWKLTNDGHSVILEVGSGMSVSGGGLPGLYHTTQLHFHWGSPASNGSEHTVEQHRYPMEMHVVNMKSVHPNLSVALEDPSGLAVLAVFMDVNYAENVPFGHIAHRLPSVAYKGQATTVKPFPLIGLLPQHNLSQYYRYHGSLTTPPCSQAVLWTVYEVPIYVSWSQLEQFSSGIFSTEEDVDDVTRLHNNYRHVHPAFSRSVSASRDARLLAAAAGRLFSSAPCVLLLLLTLATGYVYGL